MNNRKRGRTKTDANQVPKLIYTGEEARAALGGMGRTKLWQLIRLGKIKQMPGTRDVQIAVAECERYAKENGLSSDPNS